LDYKKFKDMNKEEKFLCMLDAHMNDRKYMLKLAIERNDHDAIIKSLWMSFAYDEAKTLYELIFKKGFYD
jgi:hypothetical protein